MSNYKGCNNKLVTHLLFLKHPILDSRKSDARRIAMALASYLNAGEGQVKQLGRCNPSAKRLADDLRIAEKTVNRNLERLCHPEEGIGLKRQQMSGNGSWPHYQYDWRGVCKDMPPPWKGDATHRLRNTPMDPVIVERIAKADAVIVESVKDKDWHKKLKAWQLNDDWNDDRSTPAKSLERLMTSLNHTDEEALANVETLIKHDNNLTFPSGYIPEEGVECHPMEAIEQAVTDRGYPTLQLDKFVSKSADKGLTPDYQDDW